jgi:hypothetical protein
MRGHLHGRIDQAAPDAGHHGRAGAGAAGERLACAALVHAQAHGVAINDLHETGIHAAREHGMRFDQRAVFQHGENLGVVHHLHRVRVTHRHGGDPLGAAVDLQAVQRVAAFGARGQAVGQEGQARGLEHGRAHIDGHLAVRLQGQRGDAVHDLDAHGALGRQAAVGDELDEAARAVAAVLHLAAIVVEDAIAEIDIGPRRALDQQQLVCAHAKVAIGDGAPLLGREVDRGLDAVEHDKVVARAVHLGEVQFHGGKPHGGGVRNSESAHCRASRPRPPQRVNRCPARLRADA